MSVFIPLPPLQFGESAGDCGASQIIIIPCLDDERNCVQLANWRLQGRKPRGTTSLASRRSMCSGGQIVHHQAARKLAPGIGSEHLHKNLQDLRTFNL